MNNLEQDEYGLYIHAPNYAKIRKEMDADKTHNERLDGPGGMLWAVIIFVVVVFLIVLYYKVTL